MWKKRGNNYLFFVYSEKSNQSNNFKLPLILFNLKNKNTFTNQKQLT